MKEYYPDGTIRVVKPRWPIPRKTYPDPVSMTENAKKVQEIIDILDERSKVSTDLRELREIIKLSEMAFDAAFWLRKRAEAATKKAMRASETTEVL
jgi:hypothetical protein